MWQADPGLAPGRRRVHIPIMADKRPKRPTDEEIKAKALDRWNNEGGAPAPAKRPKRPRDLNQWAKRMVDIATGEVEDEKKPELTPAQEFARQGGLKGGKARAEKLSPQQRREIARKAAAARWKKNQPAS
jgi:hypothetical protein